MLELGQKAQWFHWYDTKNARKYGFKKWTELIFWPNWAMFCPLRLKTFYTFPTKSIFTCVSLLEFIFLVFLYCIFELIRDFDLIPRLIAKLQYQLSSGSLFVEDYTQQNWWDYTQQNCDWVPLENPQIDTLYSKAWENYNDWMGPNGISWK